ncbi:MAG: hypothetical protein ACRD3L_01465 [Terriglobales bacterium]
MMVRAYTRSAKRNLRGGIEKMEAQLTAADKIRRHFLRGAPRKSRMQVSAIAAVSEALEVREELLNRLRAEAPNLIPTMLTGIIYTIEGGPERFVVAVNDEDSGLHAAQTLRLKQGKATGLLCMLVDPDPRKKENPQVLWEYRYATERTPESELERLSKFMRGQA